MYMCAIVNTWHVAMSLGAHAEKMSMFPRTYHSFVISYLWLCIVQSYLLQNGVFTTVIMMLENPLSLSPDKQFFPYEEASVNSLPAKWWCFYHIVFRKLIWAGYISVERVCLSALSSFLLLLVSFVTQNWTCCMLMLCSDAELNMCAKMPFERMRAKFPSPIFTSLPALSKATSGTVSYLRLLFHAILHATRLMHVLAVINSSH